VAILDPNRAVGDALSGLLVVAHEHDRDPLFAIELLEQCEDLLTRATVEVAGWLVSEKELWLLHQRTCNRDPLLLAGRQLRRKVIHAIGETHMAERSFNQRFPVSTLNVLQEKRELNVLERVPCGK
jgi:hypothetical protein